MSTRTLPSPSRRSFLTSAGLAAVGLGLNPRWLRAGADKANERFGGFGIGIQSYSLRAFPVAKALEIIQKDLGLHYVECFGAHFAINPDEAHIQQMATLLKSHDIMCNAHGVNGFGADHEANRKVFLFAKAAGILNISADPAPEAFASLDKLCAEFPHQRIAIHNHGPGARYDKIADVAKAVKDHHPHIGACNDTGHYIRSAEDPVKVFHELKGRVFGVHLKDFAEQEGNAKGVILGKGHLDVAGALKAMRDTGFPADGSISLEYEENPDNPVADLKECLEVTAQAARKISG